MAKKINEDDRFEGAMVGSAIGDAFGYPLQEMTYDEICERFEDIGAMELAVSGKTGTALFTDATQLSLFTADGILWASENDKAYDEICTSYVFYSYQLWLYMQTKTVAGKEYSWLFERPKKEMSQLLRVKGLTKKRFMHDTNVKALLAAHNDNFGRLSSPVNENFDNCALKRVTSVGLFYGEDPEMAFRMGCDFGAITHSHPDGYLPCGVYAAVLSGLVNGKEPEEAIESALDILCGYDGHERCYNAVKNAVAMANSDEVDPQEGVQRLGLGVDAIEALAIAMFSFVLHQGSFRFAIELAANHDGDSAACAAVTGGLMGAYYGERELPKPWLKKLQHRALIETYADRLYEASSYAAADDDE